MIISFAGNAGSGKSTVAEKIANKLNWPRYYIGGLRRERAKELGLTLEEYNQLGENNPKTDLEVDEYQTELARNNDNFIIEGRTSWHFIPQSFKIYIDVNEGIGAQRILDALKKGQDRNEVKGEIKTLEEMIQKNRERKLSDTSRYQKYYSINCFDQQNFDLIIDSSHLTPEEVYDIVYSAILAKISQ